MRIGIFLGSHFPPGEPPLEGLDAMLAQAQLADRLGYDSVFLGHHYLTHSQFLQPIATAGYVAGVTERVRIGFGVLLAPLLNPLQLAEDLATLDVLSRGRMIVGFGAGYRRKECDAFGVEWKDRIARLKEYVPLLRRLWSGEAVSASGSYGILRDARVHLQPVQPGGPPIWLGAFVRAAIERAAELDAPWIMSPHGSDEELAATLEIYRKALAERGHDLDRPYPLNREGAVGASFEQAAATIRPHLVRQYEGYRSWDQAQALDLDRFMSEQCLIGTPEAIAERLSFYERELGITEVIMRLQYTGMPYEAALESIAAFGELVLPLVQGQRRATAAEPLT